MNRINISGRFSILILCFKNTFGTSPNRRVSVAMFKKGCAPLVEVTVHGQFAKDLKMEMTGRL